MKQKSNIRYVVLFIILITTVLGQRLGATDFSVVPAELRVYCPPGEIGDIYGHVILGYGFCFTATLEESQNTGWYWTFGLDLFPEVKGQNKQRLNFATVYSRLEVNLYKNKSFEITPGAGLYFDIIHEDLDENLGGYNNSAGMSFSTAFEMKLVGILWLYLDSEYRIPFTKWPDERFHRPKGLYLGTGLEFRF